MAAKIGGGGGGKFDLGQNSDMNVTPFVDVMLVLLIIFMVVAPLATTSIRIDLPPATPPKDDKGKPPTFISIQDSGQIFVSMGKTALKPSSMAGNWPPTCRSRSAWRIRPTSASSSAPTAMCAIGSSWT